MKKSDFALGQEFYTATGQWRCTDIGTRIITAIQLNQEDEQNYNGPPFSIPEVVFDEYDMEGCYLEPITSEDTAEESINNQITLSNIEDAVEFASALGYGESYAILNKVTGKIYYQSDFIDDDETLADDEFDPKIHIEIPHKNELELGNSLVFEFTEQFLPDEYEKVSSFFRKRGAYARYKDLLEYKGVLEQWYDFEHEKTQMALLEWCKENDINPKT